MTPIKLSIAMKIPIPKKDIVAITANNKKNGFTFFKRIHPCFKNCFFEDFKMIRNPYSYFTKKKFKFPL